MANHSVVPTGEASLHTMQGGLELELRLPTDGASTPMMKFLSACIQRAEEDLGWWEEQVEWAERQNADRRAVVKRKHIKLAWNAK
jgi:hypothetical protein